jgi:serine protease Do
MAILPAIFLADPGDIASPEIEFAEARSAVVRAAVRQAAPSIVAIETIGGAQPVRRMGDRVIGREPFRLGEGPTTGVIVSPDGLILTSSFNFARDPAVVTVRLADGTRLAARQLGTDDLRRITLLKVDADDLPAIEWAPRQEIHPGQYAIACGRALGGPDPSASLGIISAMNRRGGAAMQTDAKTSPVNYGGPLIDVYGRALGVIVPMAGAGGGALAGAQWYDSGIGFAIHQHRIESVLPRLAAGERIVPGKIGVVLGPDEPSLLDELDALLPLSRGVRIVAVARKSPAAEANLEVDDKIVALDGQPVGDLPELQRILSDMAAGERVLLTIKRRWKRFDVSVMLARVEDIEGLEEAVEESRSESDETDSDDDPSPSTQPAAD